MKLKDIKVGEVYAIGASNVTYDQWRRVRGRVTKVGVHGTVSSGWGCTMSSRANYVEFELVKDDRAALPGYVYRHRVVTDKASACGGERTPQNYRIEDGKIREVLRCMGTHVLMPWDEFLVELVQHEKDVEESEAVALVRRDQAEDVRARFAKLGFKAGGYKTWCFEFNAEDAEKILQHLERCAADPPLVEFEEEA